MDWIALAQNRDWWRVLVNAVMNFGFPYNAGNFLIRREPVRFSLRILLLELSYYLCCGFQNRILNAEYEKSVTMSYTFYTRCFVRVFPPCEKHIKLLRNFCKFYLF